MFSKIKSVFSSKTNPEPSLSTFASSSDFKHPETANADVSQCPFMSKNKGKQNKPTNKQSKKDKTEKQKNKNKDSDTQSEDQQKPRGGCPFMVSSGAKKNPNLAIDHQGYDQPFVSKFKYYLSTNKINFDLLKKGSKHAPTIREKFDKYPIYLKHTLFYNGDDFKKVRTFECCSRFLAYEQLRQKGNKKFNKGKYLNALDFYQRAMSLFRWLQLQQNQNSQQFNSQSIISQSFSQSQISQNGQLMSKIPIRLNQKQQVNLQNGIRNPQLDEFTQKYKQFFIVYHDDNVKHFNGEQMTQTVDIDMRKSLLIQIYLNMAAAYIKLNHFSLANQILGDAFLLSDRVSQVYLRKAQATLYNKSSSIQQLQKGLSYIKTAVQMQPNQKIFQNTNPNILKMVNIHDAKQVYGQVCKNLEQRIEVQMNKDKQIRQQIQHRLTHINKIEQEMIRQGKQPRQSSNNNLLSQTTDYKILIRIYSKYVRIMQFYTEAKDKTQIELAKKQFQQILKTLSQIKRIQGIQIDSNNLNFGTNTQKIENRTKNIKRQKCEQLYNGVNYNFSVLEWAIKQVVNQEHQENMRKKKQEQQALKAQKTATQSNSQQNYVGGKDKFNLISKLPYFMVIVPVVGIIVNYFI